MLFENHSHSQLIRVFSFHHHHSSSCIITWGLWVTPWNRLGSLGVPLVLDIGAVRLRVEHVSPLWGNSVPSGTVWDPLGPFCDPSGDPLGPSGYPLGSPWKPSGTRRHLSGTPLGPLGNRKPYSGCTGFVPPPTVCSFLRSRTTAIQCIMS
jgi:hypothetical protein